MSSSSDSEESSSSSDSGAANDSADQYGLVRLLSESQRILAVAEHDLKRAQQGLKHTAAGGSKNIGGEKVRNFKRLVLYE